MVGCLDILSVLAIFISRVNVTYDCEAAMTIDGPGLEICAFQIASRMRSTIYTYLVQVRHVHTRLSPIYVNVPIVLVTTT